MAPTYTLYTPPGSFRAFAPLIAAEFNQISVQVETNDIEALAQTKSPTGKAPFLETPQGSVLFTSHAIARYVAGIRSDTGLVGDTFEEKVAIDQWMDWTSSQVELPACVLFYPVAGFMKPNTQATEQAIKDMKTALQLLQDSLNGKRYLVADRLTLADIVLAATLVYPFKLVCDKALFLEPYGNVVDWFSRCMALPEFQAVLGTVEICSEPQTPPLP
eukprot:Nitzschia sp. Nitz4//scaffold5_size260463//55891//56654//NITZ4_000955-RA/size260463-augustus-gene-0.3-mRNA-1//1//CDS//3329555259//6260//frame0